MAGGSQNCTTRNPPAQPSPATPSTSYPGEPMIRECSSFLPNGRRCRRPAGQEPASESFRRASDSKTSVTSSIARAIESKTSALQVTRAQSSTAFARANASIMLAFDAIARVSQMTCCLSLAAGPSRAAELNPAESINRHGTPGGRGKGATTRPPHAG